MAEATSESAAVTPTEGLRQRRPSATKKSENKETKTDGGENNSQVTTGTPGEMTEKYILALTGKIPQKFEKVIPFIKKAAPIIGLIVDLINKSIPYFIKAYHKVLELWEMAQPYRPQLLIPSFVGFIMCFFGGTFVTLIAAFEAYRLSAWEHTYECLMVLYEDFKKVEEANKKDDEVDADGDGVADVLQISNEALLQRKVLLFLRTVDPKRLTTALGGINAGFLAVVATLKMQFAKAITLGKSISERLKVPAGKYFVPLIEKFLPDDYKKWAETIVFFQVDSIAISIAWTLQRIMSACHSATVGGLLFSRNILVYLSEMKIVEINHEDTYLDEVAGYALAAAGLFFQLTFGFSLPFPLNVLLFPFSVLEWLLVRIVMRD